MIRAEELLKVAKRAAKEAGDIHIKYYHNKKIMTKGTKNDLVTNADLEADRLIRRRIHDAFPDHSIVSEEMKRTKGKAPYTWYVDPLDGTNNYAHNYPHFCVSIGLCKGKEPILGVVYSPLNRTTFWALKGKGAFRNKTKIKVSSTKSVKGSLVTTGLPYHRKPYRKNILSAFATMYDQVMGLRRTGSAALDLCFVAAGWLDSYYEYWISPWDYMAGQVIVKEAGGIVTTIDGEQVQPRKTSILAANPQLHRTFLRLLRR
ncbi:MAG: inositol monophosphatase [DPANN group archaeon]|nr:inositol monophosphatase [DPANN group archaeon]